MRRRALLLTAVLLGCGPLNSPYPASEETENTLYSLFSSPPKSLDPAVAYNVNELTILAQVCEPPLQYHYLRRPYELVPLLLEGMPRESRRGEHVVYEFRLKPGILFQEHPCFAKRPDGSPRYAPIVPAELEDSDWKAPRDFPEQGTRELVAADCVRGIQRLANPMVPCPIRKTLLQYLQGMPEYAQALAADLALERARRKAAAGAAYNQALDERANPLQLDLARHPFPGVELVDDRTFRIVLSTPYPQILYWMAMPFFAPVPEEAETFYAQGALAECNLSLARYPVGTGPFRIERLDKNRAIVLTRNPSYREERYPSEGEPGDAALGLLDRAGEKLPMADRVVFTLEKEAIPAWQKFLQGYYDSSGIGSDSFERAVSLSPEGSLGLSPEMARKGIQLSRRVTASTTYFGFNMDDAVVGGYEEARCKLRQAIAIAIDTEERIQIFLNGRGIPASSPIPPGIFGYEEGREGINPLTHDWDPVLGAPRRKPLDEARRLLAEAGYPGGIGPDGRQLTISFDSSWFQSESQNILVWMREQLAKIGVNLEIRTTDYNRFQEKIHGGNFQMFPWGWNADYPDPENFLFLLYGPNGRSHNHGPNSTNYARAEYDRLFHRMEAMPNGPERLGIIRELKRMLQHDAPWVGAYHPVEFLLFHAWRGPTKPHLMANNTLKYARVDPERRARLRREWNRPAWGPVLAAGGGVLALSLLGLLRSRKGAA